MTPSDTFDALTRRGYLTDDRLTTLCSPPYVPPDVGGRGWVGLRLDGELDRDQLAAICADAHRSVI